jgi:ABC-type nitrate/sulfonate/bicarbonate transport system substrate-binding protein
VLASCCVRTLVWLTAAVILGIACAPAAGRAGLSATPMLGTAPTTTTPAAPSQGQQAVPPRGPHDTGAVAVAEAPLSPPVDVKLSVFGSITDAGIYVALERDYFLAEGLNVETIPSDSALRIIPFLATGQVDVSGISQSPTLFNAGGRGVPIKIVADKGRISRNHGYAALVVRKDLMDTERVRDFGDLRGMRISSPGRGTASWGLLVRALEAGDLAPTEAELEELTQPDSLAALGNRALDAALLLEPFVSAAVTRGIGVRWKGADEFAPDAQNGILAYSPQFIQSQPEAARRFMVAYLRGVRDYIDAFGSGTGREEIIDILIKRTPIKDRTVYASMPSAGFDPNGRINVDFLRAEQELYAREGLLTDFADPATLVDHQYVDYAAARLGRR